jgi:hypothetical protein
VIEDWNTVPAELKQAKNVKCFKRGGYRTLREKNGGAHLEEER